MSLAPDKEVPIVESHLFFDRNTVEIKTHDGRSYTLLLQNGTELINFKNGSQVSTQLPPSSSPSAIATVSLYNNKRIVAEILHEDRIIIDKGTHQSGSTQTRSESSAEFPNDAFGTWISDYPEVGRYKREIFTNGEWSIYRNEIETSSFPGSLLLNRKNSKEFWNIWIF